MIWMGWQYINVYWQFIKNYNKNSETGYSVVVDVEYCEYLDPLHKDIPFLLEKR